MPRFKIPYGRHEQQFGHLYVPDGVADGPIPVVMQIHGGFWSGQYGLTLGTAFAVELARHGVARIGDLVGTVASRNAAEGAR